MAYNLNLFFCRSILILVTHFFVLFLNDQFIVVDLSDFVIADHICIEKRLHDHEGAIYFGNTS